MSVPLALKLPLTGTCLIEASAGTGKTYTIADFFVRLLVEGRHEIDRVLVVTFTRAATAELRDRIRQRIRAAIHAFASGEPGDNETLASLLGVRDDHAAVVSELRAALVCMDEAAIYTIHAFCQQMLRENAFESGVRFDISFELDERKLLEQAIEDFWRRRFYHEPESLIRLVHGFWKSPAELLASVRPCLGIVLPEVRPEVETGSLESTLQQFRALSEQVAAAWLRERDQVSAILTEDSGLSQAQKHYHSTRIVQMLELMDAFARVRDTELTLPDGFEYFTRERVRAGTKPRGTTPEHDFFGLCQALWNCAEVLETIIKVQIVNEAATHVRGQMQARKRELNVLSYNDLLVDLHAALKRDHRGILTGAIRRRFPVALIDEFQDTDAVQYDIFRSIYQGVEGLGLCMIGDPKQAIYSFRGADVFTYMEAKAATAQHLSLSTNWRSTRQLVGAVNVLFGQARAPFIYAQNIPFEAAEAAVRTDAARLEIEGRCPVPLRVWYVGSEGGVPFSGQGPAYELVSSLCAVEIGRLISSGKRGSVRIGDHDLEAADIAVLVRSRVEADHIQAALRRSRIASVFIARESVFASDEAQELLRVLEAVAEPGNENRVRAALCTRVLGVSAVELYEMQKAETAWELCLQRFRDYRDTWNRRSFMAMFQRLLAEEGVVERVLGRDDGERAMTNLRHLGEGLQEADPTHRGAEELVAWFRRAIRLADGDDESQQLRLESDEALVKVVTIHKSKGLQYPVVFFPFAWMGRRALHAHPPVSWHENAGTRQVIDFGSAEIERAHRQAQTERLAEDVRLLYVGLTRAEHLCYLPFAPVIQRRKNARRSGLPDSALAWLLYQQAEQQPGDDAELAEHVRGLEPDQLREPWDQLARRHPEFFALEDRSSVPGIPLALEPSMELPAAFREFRGRVETAWEMTSYSRLSTGSHALTRTENPDVLGETDMEPTTRGVEPGAERSPFTLPRGRETGNMIHAILERLDFPRARGEYLVSEVSRQLRRHGFDVQWQTAVESLVQNVLESHLDVDGGFRLCDTNPHQRIAELEFHFALGNLQAADLDRFLRDCSKAGRYGPELDFDSVKGFLSGFVDLVVEYDGRFFVIDYKTNYLGDEAGDYRDETLTRAVGEHRYDLQYLLYVVALHRYLGYRIQHYDYDSRFGGVYYLFVRGMQGSARSDSGIYFDRPTRAQVEALDALLSGHGREVA